MLYQILNTKKAFFLQAVSATEAVNLCQQVSFETCSAFSEINKTCTIYLNNLFLLQSSIFQVICLFLIEEVTDINLHTYFYQFLIITHHNNSCKSYDFSRYLVFQIWHQMLLFSSLLQVFFCCYCCCLVPGIEFMTSCL